jgi:predicted deacetylase
MRRKVNISIDDVSPHPRSSLGVLDRCFELIERFDDIKFTLFVPIAYWRTVGQTATEKPCFIEEDPKFCEVLRNLPTKNFEIGYHGYHHGIPGITNNDEFKNLDRGQAIQVFSAMFNSVMACGLEDTFKPIFRPPAWKMSPDSIDVAGDMGMKILALSPDDIYQGHDKTVSGVVYYNVNPPFKPLKSSDKVGAVYHACEWDRNFLSEEMTKQLIEFLRSVENDFCFMEEMI